MNNRNGTSLILRFRKGDRQALGTLLNGLRPYVRAIVRNMNVDRFAASTDDSDLIQDAMVQATQAVDKFQGNSVGELIRWLRTIVVRTTYRTLHSSNNLQLTDDDEACLATLLVDPEPSPFESVMRLEQSASMALAVSRLPEEMQQILNYRITDNLDYVEISRRMQRGVGAARMLYLRSLEKLRDLWRDEFESH